MSRRGRSIWLSTLATAALLASAVPVYAAVQPGSATVVTAKVTVPGVGAVNNTNGKTAKCPAGQKVIAGGAHWQEPGQGRNKTLDVFLSSSTPTGDASGWYAAGMNKENKSLELVVTAYCRPTAALTGLVVKTAYVSVVSQTTRKGALGCGTGNRLLTGGAFWHRPNQAADPKLVTILISSAPDPNLVAWNVLGWNDTAETLWLRLIAVCLPAAGMSGQQIVSADKIVHADPPEAQAATCPAGKRVTAGGVRWRYGDNSSPVMGGVLAYIRGAEPINNGTAYWVAVESIESSDYVIRVLASCLPA